MNAVEIEGVTKRFGKHVAVDELDLVVPEGAVYGFIGPNGSGKTTTMRMILRILYPNAGRVTVLGQDHGSAADDRVAYLPEERGLYKKMKVREVLRFYAQLKNVSDWRPRVADWLERFDLSEWAHRKVETLSKGMSQKVQFIATVISSPRLVVLDEPFSGLDPVNMELVRESILRLRTEGTTVILSTHDMDVAERMCDTIFMIYRGRKVLDGTLESIQNRYGEDTIRVRLPQPPASLGEIPGVRRVTDFGAYKELRLEERADSQQILTELARRGRLEHFEVARPTLRDIFIRIAGADVDIHGSPAMPVPQHRGTP